METSKRKKIFEIIINAVVGIASLLLGLSI